MESPREPVLAVDQLKQHFKVNRHFSVKAVDGVSFEIYPGETYGLVGESGSGKSTIGRSVIRLHDITDGSIHFKGKNISGKLDKETQKMLRTKMQMIFQDPMASLNPRKNVMDIVAHGLDIHGTAGTKEERAEKVLEILERVGLSKEFAGRFPSQFSGGQRQRLGIARALILNPDLIIADEAISALDVSIQAQIINLLEGLQVKHNLTYLFIAHDLSMVKYFSDRIGMMYQGKIVEVADADTLYDHPKHPYTQSLLSAIPLPDPDYEKERHRIIYKPDEAFYNPKNQLIETEPNHWVYQ